MKPLSLALLLISLVCIGSCSNDQSDGAKRHITVLVAASLSEAAQEMADKLEAQYPDYDFEINSAGSQLLEAQIRRGASAGVFISASKSRNDALKEESLASTSERLCGNRLVLVAKEGSSLKRRLALRREGVKIVVAAEEVPLGGLSFAAMRELGVLEKVRANKSIVSEEASVAGVLLKLRSGQADGGFVYATDIPSLPGFRELDLGKAAQSSEYGISILAESKLAKIFHDFALSDEGLAILERRGFVTK